MYNIIIIYVGCLSLYILLLLLYTGPTCFGASSRMEVIRVKSEAHDAGKAVKEDVEEEAAVQEGATADVEEEEEEEEEGEEEVGKGESGLCAEEVDLTAVRGLISTMTHDHEEEMRFSLWDCGGQEGFDDAHSLFLTRSSIYLLTVNMQSLLPGASSEERHGYSR